MTLFFKIRIIKKKKKKKKEKEKKKNIRKTMILLVIFFPKMSLELLCLSQPENFPIQTLHLSTPVNTFILLFSK